MRLLEKPESIIDYIITYNVSDTVLDCPNLV